MFLGLLKNRSQDRCEHLRMSLRKILRRENGKGAEKTGKDHRQGGLRGRRQGRLPGHAILKDKAQQGGLLPTSAREALQIPARGQLYHPTHLYHCPKFKTSSEAHSPPHSATGL